MLTSLSLGGDLERRPGFSLGSRIHQRLQRLAQQVMVAAALHHQHLLQRPHRIPTLPCTQAQPKLS